MTLLKKYSREIRFIINAAALTLIIMGVMQAIQAQLPDPRAPDIKVFSHKVVTIEGDNVSTLLHNPDGRPLMVVMYASWCPFCRMAMPDIVGLMQQHRLDSVKPVFLSMDHNTRALSGYLVHQDYQSLFTPYFVRPDTIGELVHTMREMGANFDGHIPYIAFFDAEGREIAELSGSVGSRDIMEMVDSLKK